MYSTPSVMLQNCKMQGCQWYLVKRIKALSQIKGIVEKDLGHLLVLQSPQALFFNKTNF